MTVFCKRDTYRYIRLIVRFRNEKFHIDQNTNFCVDTGAPYSLVNYEQAVQWSIPFDQLETAPGRQRVGGIEAPAHWLEGSQIILRDFRGRLHPVAVPKILVLGPPFKRPSLREATVPPLLGDDILRNFTLLVESDGQGGDIILTDEKINYTPS